ncbi:MAG: response regulator transcription factor [Elusimicrobia bacterium]|nr:response regulator transcription factor [Elusimicrobiota bacterium]
MNKGKILIVEDEKDLVRLLQYNLENEGFKVLRAGDAEAGLGLLRKNKPDLVILDIMLPKMDGLEFCRVVRQETQVPIIFLTAKKSEMDRILGLKLGADDYITKPFSVGELVARVQAIFRRAAVPANGVAERTLQTVGSIEVDPERHEVRVKGKLTQLTPKEFEFLLLLMKARGKVLSRDYLLEHIWGYKKSIDIDTRTVDQHIARLRRKLRAEAHRIVTVASFGYQIKMN